MRAFPSLATRTESKTEPALLHSAVMGMPKDQLTVDGYDVTWGTNTLGKRFTIVNHQTRSLNLSCKSGPFYFTKLLLPALFKGSTPENKSRVVNTSSAGSISGVSLFGSGLDFSTFKDSPRRRKYSRNSLYGQSKLVRTAILGIAGLANLKTFDPPGKCRIYPGIGPATW